MKEANITWFLLIELLLVCFCLAKDYEFTFEVPDNLEQCFYEDIDLNVNIEIEYQVIYGGKYDIDMTVSYGGHDGSLGGVTLYEGRKKQHERKTLKTKDRGQYAFCFGNKFSTFEHKIVYFYLGIGEEEKLTDDMAEKATALTQMESSCVTIHETLNTIADYQTDYRLREYTGRSVAEAIYARVHYWSMGECLVLIVLSISQVVMVRSFFRNKPNRVQPRFK